MTLLDSIVNENLITTPTTVNAPTRSDNFRGLAKQSLRDCKNTSEMLEAAGLNWKAVPMPIAIKGRTENRDVDMKDTYALVRSDTGMPLSFPSGQYKPVQNEVMLAKFGDFARLGEMVLTSATALDGGKRIIAVAETGKSAQLHNRFLATASGSYSATYEARAQAGFKVGDVFRLEFLLSNGHAPGCAFTVRPRILRLACLNGMTRTTTGACLKISHRGAMSAERLRAKVRAFVAASMSQFDMWIDSANKVASVSADEWRNKLFIATVTDTDYRKKLAVRLGLSPDATDAEMGARIIGDAITADENNRTFYALREEMGRTTKAAIDVLHTQPGAELSRGSLMHGLNAVTHFVDHEQGRTADSGVRSALFGTGARLKERAFEVATAWASTRRTA